MSKNNYRPDGFQDVTPYIIAKGASKLIDFLKEAFDAELLFRMDQPDGTVGHAQLRVGDSMIELVADLIRRRRARSTSTSQTSMPLTSGQWPPGEFPEQSRAISLMANGPPTLKIRLAITGSLRRKSERYLISGLVALAGSCP